MNLPVQQPPQVQVAFNAAPHPENRGVSVLTFACGPLVQQIFWPTDQLGIIQDALKKLQGDAPRIVVPVPVPRH